MKMLIGTLILSATIAFAQDSNPLSQGLRFDSDGHLAAYVYPDGTTDSYAYDSQWRMIRFTDRNGKITKFSYNADGSVKIVKSPNGF
jgi:YD repeat-containing protein